MVQIFVAFSEKLNFQQYVKNDSHLENVDVNKYDAIKTKTCLRTFFCEFWHIVLFIFLHCFLSYPCKKLKRHRSYYYPFGKWDLLRYITIISTYGSRCCGFFKRGVTKLEIFLPKNQHTQRLLLNLVNGVVSKVPKCNKNLTFKVIFLCQKLSESFSFFFIEEYQFRSTFLVIDIFW